MNQTKTEFQRICIELESALEEYKNRYPKNLGQIVRLKSGRITVLTGLFLCALAFLSLIPNYSVFAFLAAIGGRFFLVAIRFGSPDEETVEAEAKQGIDKIENAMAQLKPFAEYPDVENYRKGFTQQVNQVTQQKKAFQEKFDKIYKYFLWTAGFILGILTIRAAILTNMAQ